jgi:hypothetical protein
MKFFCQKIITLYFYKKDENAKLKQQNQCSVCGDDIEKYCLLCNQTFCGQCLVSHHSQQVRKNHFDIGITDISPQNNEKFDKIDQVFKKYFE